MNRCSECGAVLMGSYFDPHAGYGMCGPLHDALRSGWDPSELSDDESQNGG